MTLTIRNEQVKTIIYATVSSLAFARVFCHQNLLKSTKSHQEFYSDLDGGIIEVCPAMYASNYYGPGF